MTTDLTMLVLSAALAWLLIMLVALPKILFGGMTWATGNRETQPDAPPWVGRAGRAHANLNENLILFAILVLVVHVSGNANATTALGAQIFFGARVVHALIYIAGVPWLRTLVWAVSVAGMVMVATALIG